MREEILRKKGRFDSGLALLIAVTEGGSHRAVRLRQYRIQGSQRDAYFG